MKHFSALLLAALLPLISSAQVFNRAPLLGGDTAGNAWVDLIPYGCTTLRITAFPTR